jgi:hypothetical protein
MKPCSGSSALADYEVRLMAELPTSLHKRISAQCAKGDELAGKNELALALKAYAAAWELLPEPKKQWEAALWIQAAIGDTHFRGRDWEACRHAMMEAVKGCDGAIENPFVRLRLGQSLLELGDEREALNWMAPAFLMEGKRLFAQEDPKYLALIKTRLDAPPGGWPEGW